MSRQDPVIESKSASDHEFTVAQLEIPALMAAAISH